MLFSVIIPTYNRAIRVQQAIASIQAQSDSDWEIIVVDDGSVDDTKIILEKIKYFVYKGMFYCSEIRYIFNL